MSGRGRKLKRFLAISPHFTFDKKFNVYFTYLRSVLFAITGALLLLKHLAKQHFNKLMQ